MIQYVPYSFEGETLRGIKDYDYYLAYLYGDYMTLPPENHRENRPGIIKVEFNKNEKHL